ncbi:MAG TPA: alpha/beta fold hydrolase [Pyrinomonadaceae bacterium]|nr:alpha/beta fold hydrolase [Pyrinomonadaceae bacterium]
MRTKPLLKALCLCTFAVCLALNVYAQDLTVRDIMAEPSIAGMRVEGEKLSPDGTKVVYLWNPEGKLPRSLYMVPSNGGTAVKLLSPSDLPALTRPPQPENKLNYGVELRDEFVKARENQLGNVDWSPDSKKLIFTHQGDIYVLTLGEAKPKRFTKTQGPEIAARFLDANRIMFSQSGNVFVLDTVASTITQITREANQPNFISVGGVTPNKEGTLLAYTVTDSSKLRSLVVPNYLPDYVAANPTRRGWSEQKLFVAPMDGSRDTPFEIKLPKTEGVSNFRRMAWTADGQNLIVDRIDKDTKRRQLFYVSSPGSKSEQIILITEETDEKWQASLSVIFEPNPKKSGELFFASERDGYNHLYLAKLEAETRPVASVPDNSARVAEGPEPLSTNVKITQLTKGNWQVEWAKWDPRVDEIFFMSTAHGPTVRRIEVVNLVGKISDERILSHEEGMIDDPQISTEGVDIRVIYGFSNWNRPTELFVRRLCNVGSYTCSSTEPVSVPVKLSNTVPESFKTRKWAEPKFLEIASRDGKKIPAKIYVPVGHNPASKTKYPMVIFVHGAGYLQNVINGWNNYYREFMFNDMLTRKGYVVLDIDYRGSAGYGRDWRTDVYDFLGGKDFDDHIDSIDFMVKNYGVDQKRIGTYGGSYGGFMAAMLATRAPERIAAAAALRPVMDWKNYYATNPGYTAQRLGFPDKNPEAYKRSSPISYADKLERPLLILHGMSDDNVHVQDSVQMMEKLIRLGKTKYFEVMLYPSENHGFVRPESWTDEYERIFAFFEKTLK